MSFHQKLLLCVHFISLYEGTEQKFVGLITYKYVAAELLYVGFILIKYSCSVALNIC